MTVQLDLPPDVVDRLTHEARQSGLSLNDYILQTVLQQKASNGSTAAGEAETRRKREQAAARIIELRNRVKPDPEGWTSRDCINYGRR